MGLPLLHVLTTQPRHEGFPQTGVDGLKPRAGNRERDTSADMTKATDISCDWSIPCRNFDKMLDNFLPAFAG